MNSYIFTLLYIIIPIISFVQPRQNCKLLRDNSKSMYRLKCDNSPIISERTVIRHESKKEKKARGKNRRGPPGLPGPQGPRGQKGDRGFDGREGQMGPIGPTGVPGPRGHTGPKGDKGEMGFVGSIGPQGPPGLPGNCIKDSSWQSKKKTFHCLPGPQGPQGKHGKQGPKGDKGSIGKVGIKGEKGDTGPRGRRGPVGLPGMPGSSSAIECNDYHTEWYGRYVQTNGFDFKGFYCPGLSFLQGFEIERTDLKERFKYRCCKVG